MRILLDQSIRADARVAHLTSVTLENVGNRLVLIQMRPRKKVGSERRQKEIECLPTIARLAKEKKIILFTYEELLNEFYKARGTWSDIGIGDLLHDIPIEALPSPIRRGLFFQSNFDTHVQSKGLRDFVFWLVSSYDDRWLDVPIIKESINSREIRNLKGLHVLKTMCQNVEKKHYGDIFHIWAGHTNNIDWFLTTDFKLKNAVASRSSDFPTCYPITPSELLEKIGISERDPMPYEFGKRYTLQGIPWD